MIELLGRGVEDRALGHVVQRVVIHGRNVPIGGVPIGGGRIGRGRGGALLAGRLACALPAARRGHVGRCRGPAAPGGGAARRPHRPGLVSGSAGKRDPFTSSVLSLFFADTGSGIGSAKRDRSRAVPCARTWETQRTGGAEVRRKVGVLRWGPKQLRASPRAEAHMQPGTDSRWLFPVSDQRSAALLTSPPCAMPVALCSLSDGRRCGTAREAQGGVQEEGLAGWQELDGPDQGRSGQPRRPHRDTRAVSVFELAGGPHGDSDDARARSDDEFVCAYTLSIRWR
jgi:hypothetical protein